MSEWADTYRRLSSEASAEPGNWRTSRAEYQRGMMDALCDPGTEMVVLKTSSQVGKTEILNNILGYYIHQDPAPVMLIQPTLDMSLAYSKDRLRPMMRDTPVLNAINEETLATKSGHKNSSTLLHKSFPGGHLTMTGANSAASLASRPIRILLADEVDRAPPSAGHEGDPINLAKKRTTTYWNRKIILVSTPTIEGESRIDTAFQSSDQRYYFLPCPHCGHYQRLVWTNVIWPEGEPENAKYGCESCGVMWTDQERWGAVKLGEWRATEKFTGTAGFHLSELYSTWVRLGSTAQAFLEARRAGAEFLKVWTNTAMGECWSTRPDNEVDWVDLFRRREHYLENGTIPDEVQAVVCSIDCQDDRFEMEFVGYGYGEESWGLGYVRLYGDPSRIGIWEKLTQTVRRQFQRNDGEILDVRMVTIDSGGHYTDEVYQWCQRAGRRWAIPIKGHSLPGKAVAKFPRKPGKDHKVYLTMVGTDTAKEVIYARYASSVPGPGYCHFPVNDDYDEEYFQQLVSESRVKKITRGRETYEWQLNRRRNEVSDVRVYSLAAIRILQGHYGVKLAKTQTKKAQNVDIAGKSRETAGITEPERKNTKQKGKKGGNFVDYGGSWL